MRSIRAGPDGLTRVSVLIMDWIFRNTSLDIKPSINFRWSRLSASNNETLRISENVMQGNVCHARSQFSVLCAFIINGKY